MVGQGAPCRRKPPVEIGPIPAPWPCAVAEADAPARGAAGRLKDFRPLAADGARAGGLPPSARCCTALLAEKVKRAQGTGGKRNGQRACVHALAH